MSSFIRVLCMSVLMLYAVSAFAETNRLNQDEKNRTRQFKYSDETDMLRPVLPEQPDKLKLDKTGTDEAPEKEFSKKEFSEKEFSVKPVIHLSADTGDTQIALKWSLDQYPVKFGKKPPKYEVSIGDSSEKDRRLVKVGFDNTYTIRNLKNNQTYFVMVMAYSDDDMLIARSREMQVTPQPKHLLMSPMERFYSKQTKTYHDRIISAEIRRELKQFGYDFFRNTAQLTQNTATLSVGDDYVIGPGDTMNITLWGSVSERFELKVDANGEILIPTVGAVKLWGLSFASARQVITKHLNHYYRNFDSSVTFGSLRSIQVSVVGEVDFPGVYSISSVAGVVNALALAGGPSKNGSLRSVRVSRGGKPVAEIDLYEIMLTGSISKEVKLQNGDIIFVPVIGPVAAVAGEVRRPAIYEIKSGTSLAELMVMAGGLTPKASKSRVQIESFSPDGPVLIDHEIRYRDFDNSIKSIVVKDHDMVKIFALQEAARQTVVLKGNVLVPGEYQFRPGMTLKDLIPDYNILLPDSYVESVEVQRLVPPDLHREVLTVSMKKMLEGDPASNIKLQDQDTVKVFSRWEMQEKPKVGISGAVFNPGVFDYYPGMTVRDLVTAAGSARRGALMENAELGRVVLGTDRAQPQRLQFDLSRALASDPEHNITLKPDDVVVIRTITDWTEPTEHYIQLKGEVRFPGNYSISPGERLSSLITRAGGFSKNAYLKGAKFTRKRVKELQQKNMNEIISRTEKDILQKQASLASVSASKEETEATKAALETLMKNLDRMKTLKAEGRMVIQLKDPDKLAGTSFDVELEGGDELLIPRIPSEVTVLGEVYNPTSFVFNSKNNALADYFRLSGGPTRSADESQMYVIRSDGSVASRNQSSLFNWNLSGERWSFGGFLSIPAEPGDTLVVPQKIENVAWMRDIKDITQILANVAMTAGSVYLWFK